MAFKFNPFTGNLDNTGLAIGGSTGQFQYNNAGLLGGSDALFFDTINDRIGIGTTAPTEKGDVKGNFKVKDADTATKAYRFRTSGGALDLESGGANIFLSTWQNADFSGTQYNQIIFHNDGSAVEVARSMYFNFSPNSGAGQAPIKFNNGTLMTTPENGAIEFDGTHYYGTVGTTRYQFDAITRIITSISSPTTAGAVSSKDYVYLVTGTTTLTLPTAVGNTNKYTVKNSGVNTVTIATTSTQTIDGSATATITVQYVSLDIISDGANWQII